MIRKYTFQKMQIFEKIDQSSPTLLLLQRYNAQ